MLVYLFPPSPLQKKQKDAGAPKRPMSAYMLWLNSSRERIKADHPGISITEISKKAGEMWKQITKDKKEVRAPFSAGTTTCFPQKDPENASFFLQSQSYFCYYYLCCYCCDALW